MIKEDERIREIVDKLKKYDDAYYNAGDSELSDEEYDLLKDNLRAIDPENEYLKTIGAPVRDTSWEKATHRIQMSSLNKADTKEELAKWLSSISFSAGQIVVLQEKLDGLSINCEYIDGKLNKCVTRGTGRTGENIFENVRLMKNVRSHIHGFSGCIRGEIVLFAEDFEELLKHEDAKNMRNSSVGISKRFDHKYSELLTVLFYDVESDELELETEESKISWLEENKVRTVTTYVCSSADDIFRIYDEYIESKRALLRYDIDGLVAKLNFIEKQKSFGFTNDRPATQVAFKFPALKVETKILDVEWQLGRSGKITPVANLEPVSLGGIRIKRASLHNLSLFSSLNLGFGDTVVIKRSGDVIPQVESVKSRTENNRFEPIKTCPVCHESTKISGKFLVCKNDECAGSAFGDIIKWTVKVGIQKLGVGKKTLKNMFDAELIKTPADLYRLKIEQIRQLDRQGERSSQKIIDAVKSRNKLDLVTFVGGLNLHGFSSEMAQKLIDSGYDSINKMICLAEKEDFSSLILINGIGEKVAKCFIDSMNKKREIIKDLLSVVEIEDRKEKVMNIAAKTSGILSGKSFCFTGMINKINEETGKHLTREEMWDIVKERGGLVEKSLKKGTDFLVQSDSNSVSGKTQKAKKLGVIIVSEEDFFKMINF